MNYFITSIYDKMDHPANHRTFGYYRDYKDALEAVRVNRCNLHECLYNLLVIEAIGEGIHPTTKLEWWFRWSKRGKCWKPLKKVPTSCVGFCNWALG